MAKKLHRSQTQKMIGGICGGLGEYFDIDVNLVRLLFVALWLMTALLPMAIFYIIAWIILPEGVESK
ncbi:MAG: PspC domain-containing protein [Candidatus Aminicenantes bacterium]|nr:MAG: PspC domain-containing protein [Candidatus Aminicenantes bacterium]